MTPREKELFDIIRENPLISQNEIAARMNTTRSAVSVYLNSMYKSGILLGRGYIINDQSYPVVIGPGHVDILSMTAGFKSSNIFTALQTQLHYGGSAKNIVNLLFTFSAQPRAVFIVGDDNLGTSFLNACAEDGISPAYSVRLENASTPVYVEIVDENREIIAGSFSSLSSVVDQSHRVGISPIVLRPHEDMLRTASIFIVHDSMSPQIMEYLHSSFPDRCLLLVGSSPRYITQHMNDLSHFSTAILSLEIAAALAWQKEDAQPTTDDVNAICRLLLQRGMSRFYIMVDPHTLVFCSHGQVTLHKSDNPSAVGDYFTHYYADCRDYLAAVITYDHLNGADHLSTLNHLAAARNLARSRDYYFEHSVPLQALLEAADALPSRVVTYELS